MVSLNLASPASSTRKFLLNDAIILLNEQTGELFGYNETARAVWEALECGHLDERWIEKFAAACGVVAAQVHTDIRAIVAQWRATGLIEDASMPWVRRQLDIVDWRSEPIPLWSSCWKCKIRERTFEFALEAQFGASAYRMLKHLEMDQLKTDISLQVRTTSDGCAALVENGVERFRTREEAQLIGGLWQAIVDRVYPDVETLAFMHGAAFEFDGRGVGLCAPSGSGKSTLVAALMAEGFHYLSDDVLGLSSSGLLVPIPLPLSIKPGSLDVLKTRYPSLHQADKYFAKGMSASLLIAPDAWDTEPMPFGEIIFPKYVSGAKPELKKISSFESFQRLAAERLWLGYPLEEARVHEFFDWIARTPSYSITYGDLDASIHLIKEILH
jgi:Coenzyme PQQ synthesis protein D (PqqD)